MTTSDAIDWKAAYTELLRAYYHLVSESLNATTHEQTVPFGVLRAILELGHTALQYPGLEHLDPQFYDYLTAQAGAAGQTGRAVDLYGLLDRLFAPAE